MIKPLVICCISFAFTTIPFLASLTALLSTEPNNTGSTATATFPARFYRFVARFGHFTGDASLTALPLTVLVAVKYQWDLKIVIWLARGAILWEASLGVCPLQFRSDRVLMWYRSSPLSSLLRRGSLILGMGGGFDHWHS
jgi:hypothetical protein